MGGHSILTLINRIHASIKPVLNSLIILLLGAGFVVAAEIDDSSMFVDAFTAYQKKDYPLAIRKLSTLNQLFPDSPLRDVILLLLTRSSLKSGNNELAAHSLSRFTREFSGHPFTPGPDEDLQQLILRQQRGEKLSPDLILRSDSQKTRNAQILPEQPLSRSSNMQEQELPVEAPPTLAAAARNASGERAPERTVPAKFENSSNISAEIKVSDKRQVVEIGQSGSIPFLVLNQGPHDEDFILEVSAPAEYKAHLTLNGSTPTQPISVRIRKSSRVTGTISYQMPPDKLDGNNATITLLVSSARFQHVLQSRDIPVATAAPLIRVVARSLTLKPAPGELLHYRITILNVGTVPGRELTARIFFPQQIEFLDAPGSTFRREAADTIAFKVDKLENGKLVEFTMNVRIRENSIIGKELRSRIEIVHERLQIKEVFTSLATEVRKK